MKNENEINQQIHAALGKGCWHKWQNDYTHYNCRSRFGAEPVKMNITASFMKTSRLFPCYGFSGAMFKPCNNPVVRAILQ